MANVFDVIGAGVSGVCDIGYAAVDGVVGPQGIFAKTLDAVGQVNPFRTPKVAPGERAFDLELKLMQLNQLLAQQRGTGADDAADGALRAKLDEVSTALAGADLTTGERDAIMARILAHLSNQNIAQKTGQLPPDDGQLLDDLKNLLKQYDIPEKDATLLVTQLGDIVRRTEEKTAA
jgi:hypothetical protein